MALPAYADKAPRNRAQREALEDARREEPAYARAFARFSRGLIDAAAARRLRASLARRDKPAKAVASIGWFDPRDPGADERWSKLTREIAAAYTTSLETAGQTAADALPGRGFKFRVAKATDVRVPPNPHSLRWIRERGGELIKGISDDQRQVIARRIERGYKQGERPEDMVASIQRNIGLTERQADAVDRRREAAVESGMSEERADSIAQDYADQALEARANTIARTENKAAQSRGQQDAWTVAVDEGLLPKTAQKRWVSMPESPRLSNICRELDGQTVPIDEPFHSDVLGEDLDAPPAHPNCRSTVVLDFSEV